MFYFLSLNDGPYSKLEMFFTGVALVAALFLLFKFLAKGNKDNIDEIPETCEDNIPDTSSNEEL